MKITMEAILALLLIIGMQLKMGAFICMMSAAAIALSLYILEENIKLKERKV